MTCPHQAQFEQSIRNRGMWLMQNETALKAVQSFLSQKFYEAYERDTNSEDLDNFLVEIDDHMLLLVKTIASLRQANFWPELEPAAEPSE